MTGPDPLRNFRFRLEVGNVTQAGFSEVTIADTTIDAIEYREGSDDPHLRKLPGLIKYGNVTLKRGLFVGPNDTLFFDWQANAAKAETGFRRLVVIVVQDEAANDAVRFVINDAWPVKYSFSPLNGKGNEVVVETLELTHHGVDRVKG
jgi:phage tail-like protein